MCEFDGIDMEDWEIIGPMSEQLSEEKRERDRIYQDMLDDDDGVMFDKD